MLSKHYVQVQCTIEAHYYQSITYVQYSVKIVRVNSLLVVVLKQLPVLRYYGDFYPFLAVLPHYDFRSSTLRLHCTDVKPVRSPLSQLHVIVTQTVAYSVLKMNASEWIFPCGFFVMTSSDPERKNSSNECLFRWR